MRIVTTKVLRGPNYWSNYRKKLIEMKLDIGRFEELPSNMIEGFNERLLTILPGLRNDHCSEGFAGGFVKRLEEGTWMGHVIEHVALELQCIAGMECGYGRTRSTAHTGVYHVVFNYEYESAGILAATVAVALVDALANEEAYDLQPAISALTKIAGSNEPQPLAKAIMACAKEYNMPFQYHHKDGLIVIGQGVQQSSIILSEVSSNTTILPQEDLASGARSILNNIFPAGKAVRIPVVAVTGTNGKTTTSRLVAHIAALNGHSVGLASTDGIYLNNNCIKKGDCSGPRSAGLILNNQETSYAVLECARGGILRSGLGFDNCNISIVTNVSEDHIGLSDIEHVEQLARVKSVVAGSTFDEGYAILNAEDALVLPMRKKLDCHIALFAIDGSNPDLVSHVNAGGTAAFLSGNCIMLVLQGRFINLVSVSDVPLSFNGTSQFMIQNVLAATLAAALSGFSIESIVEGLSTFYPSIAQTPGRLNVFELKNGRLIIDYVHNTGGFLALQPFIKQQVAGKKTGIIYATGDRRPEDIRLIGVYAAEMFDQIIINNEHEARGVATEDLTNWLLEGIRSVNASLPVEILPDEIAALSYAVSHAQHDELVFASINDIPAALGYMNDYSASNLPAY